MIDILLNKSSPNQDKSSYIVLITLFVDRMIKIDIKYKNVLLEVLEDKMYKLSLELDELKGGPLDSKRKELDNKQKEIEELQHIISSA